MKELSITAVIYGLNLEEMGLPNAIIIRTLVSSNVRD